MTSMRNVGTVFHPEISALARGPATRPRRRGFVLSELAISDTAKLKTLHQWRDDGMQSLLASMRSLNSH